MVSKAVECKKLLVRAHSTVVPRKGYGSRKGSLAGSFSVLAGTLKRSMGKKVLAIIAAILGGLATNHVGNIITTSIPEGDWSVNALKLVLEIGTLALAICVGVFIYRKMSKP